MIATATALAGAGKAAKAVGKFMAAVPLWVWLALAVACAWWWDRGAQYEAGVAAENDRWTTAQAEADREARVAEARRDKDGAKIDTQSDQRAGTAVAETRSETAGAVEVIRYEIRTVEVPASCNRPMPDRVRDEFAKAVGAANAAGDPLRKGRDP